MQYLYIYIYIYLHLVQIFMGTSCMVNIQSCHGSVMGFGFPSFLQETPRFFTFMPIGTPWGSLVPWTVSRAILWVAYINCFRPSLCDLDDRWTKKSMDFFCWWIMRLVPTWMSRSNLGSVVSYLINGLYIYIFIYKLLVKIDTWVTTYLSGVIKWDPIWGDQIWCNIA